MSAYVVTVLGNKYIHWSTDPTKHGTVVRKCFKSEIDNNIRTRGSCRVLYRALIGSGELHVLMGGGAATPSPLVLAELTSGQTRAAFEGPRDLP